LENTTRPPIFQLTAEAMADWKRIFRVLNQQV